MFLNDVWSISGHVDPIPDCSCHKAIFLLFSIGDDFQPRPQGAFPWLWGRGGKAREKRPGDEVG